MGEHAVKMKMYGGYDYESEYTKQLDKLEEYELREILRRKEVPYNYKTKTITSGRLVEVEIYPVFSCLKDMPRKKERGTRKAQRDLNDKNARKKFIRLICTNFSTGDYWCTFNYKDAPKTWEEAEKVIKNYIGRLNYKRKKMGLPNTKYIYITEFGQKGRVHHHVIMDNLLDRDTVEDTWIHGKRNQVRRLEEDDFGLTGLATYLSKDPKGRKRWKSSRNLKKPKETESYSRFRKRRVIRMVKDQEQAVREIRKEYPALKFLDVDIRHNGINGLFYVYARMVKQE
jgi:hypothetical protein